MNKKLLGFHSFWENESKSLDREKEKYDIFIVAMILSALQWEKFNGGMKLYADYNTLKKIGDLDCLDAYSRGVDVNSIEKAKKEISSSIWSFPKFCAMKNEPLGSVSIDVDLIVWRNMCEILNKSDVVVAHEVHYSLLGDIYSKEIIDLSTGYVLPSWFDESATACNMSISCFNDQELKNEYISEAENFKNKYPFNYEVFIASLLFIEQWSVSMVANYLNKELSFVFDDLFRRNPGEEYGVKKYPLTHLWGFKNSIVKTKEIEIWFMKNILRILKRDFYSYYEKILKNKPEYIKYENEENVMFKSDFLNEESPGGDYLGIRMLELY